MPEVLRMPEVAASTPEAILNSWLVPVNTPFSAGDPIVTVETEKAVVDVEAEAGGLLLRLLVDEGTTVEVGTPIAVWGDAEVPAGELEAFVASLGIAGVPDAVSEAPSEPVPVPTSAPKASPVPAGTPPVAVGASASGRTFASPLARKIARDSGLDLAGLVG